MMPRISIPATYHKVLAKNKAAGKTIEEAKEKAEVLALKAEDID